MEARAFRYRMCAATEWSRGSSSATTATCRAATAARPRAKSRPLHLSCPGTPCQKIGYCGDGVIQAGLGEQCDDGNGIGGDGCSSTCRLEPFFVCQVPGAPCSSTLVCGDRLVQGSETCDDGNKVPGDGCGATCQTEPAGSARILASGASPSGAATASSLEWSSATTATTCRATAAARRASSSPASLAPRRGLLPSRFATSRFAGRQAEGSSSVTTAT